VTAFFVRAADRSDWDRIVLIEALAFERASWGPKSVREGLATALVNAFVVCRTAGEAPDGFALWRSIGEEAEILSIAVAPDRRRRGMGKALLDEVLVSAAAEGMRALFLEVDAGNEPARSLYDRAGFRKVGLRKKYYRNGADALVLRKDL
jgi:ribosomal-protein-alanine N-acetyltransferase